MTGKGELKCYFFWLFSRLFQSLKVCQIKISEYDAEKKIETATLLSPFTLKISLVILLTACYYNYLKVSLESFELDELIITSLIKFLYSYYLPVEIAFEIVRRNSVLVTHSTGVEGLNEVLIYVRKSVNHGNIPPKNSVL